MTVQEKCFELDGGFNAGMVKEMVDHAGKLFSLNGSNTGSALCLKIDVENDKVYYQECYSEYGNFTGKNIYGDPRTDKLNHPRPGLRTMTLYEFYSAAFGWV